MDRIVIKRRRSKSFVPLKTQITKLAIRLKAKRYRKIGIFKTEMSSKLKCGIPGSRYFPLNFRQFMTASFKSNVFH